LSANRIELTYKIIIMLIQQIFLCLDLESLSYFLMLPLP
jgi:hypothetical protein